MKKIKFIFRLIICLFLFNTHNNIKAADRKENIKVLVLTNKKNGKVKYIKVGKRVVFFTKEGKKIKGKIGNVSDSTITIKEKEYKLSEITSVRTTYLATKISGGVFGSVGLVCTVGGLSIFIQNYGQSGCDAGIARIIGLILAVIGIGILGIGILLFTIGKKHKSKKWKFSTAQVAE